MKSNLVYEVISSKIYITPKAQVWVRENFVVFHKDDVTHKARIIEYWQDDRKHSVCLLTNQLDIDIDDIIAIYDRRWQIELLFKQLKQNFPLKYFYGESVNAIQSQIWVTLIANLLLTIVKKQVKRPWAFSNMVTMIRQMLMYYVDLHAFLENPEMYWKELNEEINESPPEPTLFDVF